MSGQTLTKRCPSPLHVGERDVPVENFSPRKDSKSGYKSWCKSCISAQHRLDPSKQKARSTRWAEKNAELIKQRSRDYYVTNAEKVKKYQRQYLLDATPEKRERIRRREKEWRRLNPDKVREGSRKSRERNQEYLREYHRRWVAEHPDESREYQKKYKAANPEVLRAARHRRRSGRIGNASKQAVLARWDYFNGKCWMCGEPAVEMDHVKPVSKGGGAWASNLRPACQFCNRSKGSKWPFPTNLWGLSPTN